MDLLIGNKEYHIEYTIEASLHKDCTEQVTEMMLHMSEAQSNENVKEMVSSMNDIPSTTLTMFYAGLLEHHGEDGDNTVTSKKEAKKLLKQYFSEHKEEDSGNFYGFMELLLKQMEEDGFFKQTGLEQMMKKVQEKEPKMPQDHKKKNVNNGGK